MAVSRKTEENVASAPTFGAVFDSVNGLVVVLSSSSKAFLEVVKLVQGSVIRAKVPAWEPPQSQGTIWSLFERPKHV